MKRARPKVATITLSWNAKTDVEKMLACVKKQTYKPSSIIVVDSGSTDGTSEMLREKFPWVKFHPIGKNIGYAAGYNVAFSLVPKDVKYVVVLDQDVTIERDYIEKVVERFEKEPESTAILMCGLIEPLIKSFGLPESYITGFHGSCFSYRNKYSRYMRYDEKFFGYANETDLSVRLLDRGLRILYYPGCRTFHKKDSTIMNSFRTYLMTRNALWLWWKNAPALDAVIGSAVNLGIFYSKATRYKTLPAYFRAIFAAFAGLPYCLKNRKASRVVSYRDLDDIRKIAAGLERARVKGLFQALDKVYEKYKIYTVVKK